MTYIVHILLEIGCNSEDFETAQTFPRGLFYILRTIHILRGLSVGMESPFSSAELWKPLALQALASSGNSFPSSDPGVLHFSFRVLNQVAQIGSHVFL